MNIEKHIQINAMFKSGKTELNIYANVIKENAELDPTTIITYHNPDNNSYESYENRKPTKDRLKVIGIAGDEADKLILLSNKKYVDSSTVKHKLLDNTRENAKEKLRKAILHHDESIPKEHILSLVNNELPDEIDNGEYEKLTHKEQNLYEDVLTNETVISNLNFILEFIEAHKDILYTFTIEIHISSINYLEINICKKENTKSITVFVKELLASNLHECIHTNAIPFKNLDIKNESNQYVFEDTFKNIDTYKFIPRVYDYTADYIKQPTKGTAVFYFNLKKEMLDKQNMLLKKAASGYRAMNKPGLTEDEIKLLSYPKRLIVKDSKKSLKYNTSDNYDIDHIAIIDTDLDSLDVYVDNKVVISLKDAINLTKEIVNSLTIDYKLKKMRTS